MYFTEWEKVVPYGTVYYLKLLFIFYLQFLLIESFFGDSQITLRGDVGQLFFFKG